MNTLDSSAETIIKFLSTSYPHIDFHTENTFEIDDTQPEYPENTYTKVIHLSVKGIELYKILIIHSIIDPDFTDDTCQHISEPEDIYDYPYVFKINNVFRRYDNDMDEDTIIEDGFDDKNKNVVIRGNLLSFDRYYLQKDNLFKLLSNLSKD